MLLYIARRFLSLLVILLGLTFFVFAMTAILPSDPVQQLLASMGAEQNPEVISKLKEQYGLDKPFLVQYVEWMKGVVQGDLGMSVHYGQTVNEVLSRKLPNTINLAVASFFLMIIIAFPLGILSAVYHKKPIDTIIRMISFVGLAMPNFWVGLILIYWLAVQLKLLPVSGSESAEHLIMPSITLAIGLAALFIRRIRSAMLEQMNQLYILGGEARGLSRMRIIFCHVLPNSLLTLVTLLGISFGDLLGGTMIVETIFGWNGIGKTAIEAITNRDYQLIQGYVLWVGTIYVMVNLLVDISYKYLDPRIRIAGSEAKHEG